MLWWLARGERDLPADPGWLSPSEAARAAQLRFTKRRTEFRLRRLTAKAAVAAVSGLPSDAATLARIEVRNAPTGAPFVLLDGAPSGWEVSLSDRAGWAVCLVTDSAADRRGTVGCDLELVEPRSPGFVRDFLTDAEQVYVAQRPDVEAQHAAANLIWSAKESALKVLRTGLRRDTRSVAVSVGNADHGGWSPLTVRAAEGRVFPGWWRRDGRFVFTVAATAARPAPTALEDPAVLATAEPSESWRAGPVSDPDRPR